MGGDHKISSPLNRGDHKFTYSFDKGGSQNMAGKFCQFFRSPLPLKRLSPLERFFFAKGNKAWLGTIHTELIVMVFGVVVLELVIQDFQHFCNNSTGHFALIFLKSH